jgi:hypothetical protein
VVLRRCTTTGSHREAPPDQRPEQFPVLSLAAMAHYEKKNHRTAEEKNDHMTSSDLICEDQSFK